VEQIPQCGTKVQLPEMSFTLTDEEYLMIRDLAQEQEITIGRVNISALSKQLNYDRKTIRKYLLPPLSPSKLRCQPKASKLDPFKDHICERLEQFPLLSSIRLYEETHMNRVAVHTRNHENLSG
jgi:transposase